MTPTGEWTTPADMKNELQRHWDRGRILKARLEGTPFFPRALRFRRPDTAALAARFDEVRQWIRALEDGSKAARGFGYDIEWREINHRQLGRNRLPAGIRVASELDAFQLIGTGGQARRFTAQTSAILQQFPMLRDWLVRYPLTVLDHVDDWARIIATLAWFRDHPASGLYMRQIDIPDVDTKFIEARRGLLAELLDLVLPPEAVDTRFATARSFELRYRLAARPALVRFRLLDPRLAIGGLTDLTIPARDFARLHIGAARVFITENEINCLAFPEVADSLVIFGSGNAVGLLADAAWLATTPLHYWGDIDTHGFAILDRLRAAFPDVQSLLMDSATLLAHRASWVQERERYDGMLSRLTVPEQDLFEALRSNQHGERVRLEQERIAFGWLLQALSALRIRNE
jgi:hypothetical protein